MLSTVEFLTRNSYLSAPKFSLPSLERLVDDPTPENIVIGMDASLDQGEFRLGTIPEDESGVIPAESHELSL